MCVHPPCPALGGFIIATFPQRLFEPAQYQQLNCVTGWRRRQMRNMWPWDLGPPSLVLASHFMCCHLSTHLHGFLAGPLCEIATSHLGVNPCHVRHTQERHCRPYYSTCTPALSQLTCLTYFWDSKGRCIHRVLRLWTAA